MTMTRGSFASDSAIPCAQGNHMLVRQNCCAGCRTYRRQGHVYYT
jgi:hypothetical protein